MPAATSTPRDYSLFSLFTAGLACLVPLTTAYTQADGELKVCMKDGKRLCAKSV